MYLFSILGGMSLLKIKPLAGQKRAVFVYRFITAGTLEEKILAIQERKQRLADSVITAATSIPLTDEELLEVL